MTFGGSSEEYSGRPFGTGIVRIANGLIRLIGRGRRETSVRSAVRPALCHYPPLGDGRIDSCAVLLPRFPPAWRQLGSQEVDDLGPGVGSGRGVAFEGAAEGVRDAGERVVNGRFIGVVGYAASGVAGARVAKTHDLVWEVGAGGAAGDELGHRCRGPHGVVLAGHEQDRAGCPLDRVFGVCPVRGGGERGVEHRTEGDRAGGERGRGGAASHGRVGDRLAGECPRGGVDRGLGECSSGELSVGLEGEPAGDTSPAWEIPRSGHDGGHALRVSANQRSLAASGPRRYNLNDPVTSGEPPEPKRDGRCPLLGGVCGLGVGGCPNEGACRAALEYLEWLEETLAWAGQRREKAGTLPDGALLEPGLLRALARATDPSLRLAECRWSSCSAMVRPERSSTGPVVNVVGARGFADGGRGPLCPPR